MVERKIIVDKISTFVSGKLNEILDSNPFSFIIKPYVSRVANNYIGKLDLLLRQYVFLNMLPLLLFIYLM